jgi:uncharacterized heparinase superfamily protein
VLDDGGHFELSPMYHSLMLDLVLDVLQLASSKGSPKVLAVESKNLVRIARIMGDWLAIMCHPDGEIAYFNDAAIGIAQSPRKLRDRASKHTGARSTKSLANLEYLSSTGYVRLATQDAVLFMDVANIGASYLPGHGHADALSIEFSLFNQRFIVNTGVSEYGEGPRRVYERSTSAHSTLEINEQNSSEIWAGFRVGRRAKVKNLVVNKETSVSAEHDGYGFLPGKPIHHRSVHLSDNMLVVEDDVEGINNRSIVRFHLHPDVSLVVSELNNSGYMVLPNGDKVAWESDASHVSVESNKFASEFGKLLPMKTLVLHKKSNNKVSFKLKWM